MARRFDYFFRETATGIKRNGLATFAAISTAFIALLLLGLALLVRREVDLIVAATGGKVEVSVYLSDTVSPTQQQALLQKIQAMPQVSGVEYVSKEQALAIFQRLFKDQQDLVSTASAEALPASFKVSLTDPELYKTVAAQLQGEPGIDRIVDQHELVDKVFKVTSLLRNGVLIVGILMLISSAFLIANTVRLGLFARRKEIGIMKLVGATNWFIRIPFIIEGIVQGLIGAVLAIFVLMILKQVYINPEYGLIQFLPWVQTSDVIVIVPILLAVGVLVAVIASLIGMRRFLDV
jgi:cell division transport system permease protein